MKKFALFILNLLKRPRVWLAIVVGLVLVVPKLIGWPSIDEWFKPKPVIIASTPLVITQIKQIAELHTLQLYAEVVVDSNVLNEMGIANDALRRVGMMGLPVSEYNTLVIIAKGNLRAGINLATLHDSAVFTQGDSIAIRLPAAQVLEVIINPSDFETFIETGTWNPQAVQAVKAKAKKQLMALAQSQNLTSQAQARACIVIEQFLRAAGFKRIHLTFND